MKARDVAVQGVLAAVALVAAFFVWQREPARAPGEVTVEDAQPSALDRIRYDEETRFVELFRDPQDRDTIWVRLGSKPAKPGAGAQSTTDAGGLAQAASDAGSAALDAGANPHTNAGSLASLPDGGANPHTNAGSLASLSDGGANPRGNAGAVAAASDGGANPRINAGSLASLSDGGANPRSNAGAVAAASDGGASPHINAGAVTAASDGGANPRTNAGVLAAASDGGASPRINEGAVAAASDGGASPRINAGMLASASADVGTPASPASVPPPRELRGNDVALKLFARLAPLRAQRDLGVLDDAKLEEIGLAKTERGLTLTLDGTPRTFRLAAPASGWGAPYLQRTSDGHVFLLGPALLTDLEAAASRLVDRRLHTFDVDGFDRVVISTGTASRAFIASGKPPGAVQLSPVDAPGTPDDFARNWHDRLWRLTPVELLGRGEAPPGPAPTPAFRVEYQRAGKTVGELSMAKASDNSWYARTEFTPGWVRMGGGLELLAEDAAKLTAPR
ncbi:hypothetical protein [Corallococcus exercitus]|uniref:hypothetical protein n=1 Tax=Corallococcus exercitus TaxID=2316736 RepID=UPI001ABEF9D5|nr:hypothetical protein [Corallococcus exercitus]